MSLPSKERSAETLAAELGASLKGLRDALRVVLRLVQQLEAHSAYTAAIAQGRAVRIKPAPGEKREVRGRPLGAKNGVVMFAGPHTIARLKSELDENAPRRRGRREGPGEGERSEGVGGGAGENKPVTGQPTGTWAGSAEGGPPP